MTQILSGTELSSHYRTLVQEALSENGWQPGLSMILVGDNPSSQIYVSRKEKMCHALGIRSRVIRLPETISQAQLLSEIEALNQDPDVHGILLQLPLPGALHSQEALWAIRPEKDVDGLHPTNLGRLCAGLPGMVPCTPQGCLQLIRSVRPDITGARAVVLGRSVLVGKPMALLLSQHNATVTLAHSKSLDVQALCRQAEILVVAIGRPGWVTPEFVHPEAIVIDVGITSVDGKVKGDVQSTRHGRAVTPVPGGVGPMTVINLMLNTVKAYCIQNQEALPERLKAVLEP